MEIIFWWVLLGIKVTAFILGIWLFIQIVRNGPEVLKTMVELLNELFRYLRSKLVKKMKEDEAKRQAEKEAAEPEA